MEFKKDKKIVLGIAVTVLTILTVALTISPLGEGIFPWSSEYSFFRLSNSEVSKLPPSVGKLISLAECAEDDECSVHGQYRLRDEITRNLLELQIYIKDGSLVDKSIALDFGRFFLLYPDDFVKAASLQVMAMLPKNEKNLDRVIAGISVSNNEDLLARGIVHMSRYNSVGNKKIVNDFLSKVEDVVLSRDDIKESLKVIRATR